MIPELLTAKKIWDSGYLGAEKREEAIVRNQQGKPIRYQISRRPFQSNHASPRSQARIKRREREKSWYGPR